MDTALANNRENDVERSKINEVGQELYWYGYNPI